ncbi:sulfotransferase family 2 domain-containing protein [Novosphingobium sp.]|uniref:sulfotransferase family 2 domain-containing protein n=1 Tax=Novosphingobium sp. TaxID=1874826 RepID=UPI0031D23321
MPQSTASDLPFVTGAERKNSLTLVKVESGHGSNQLSSNDPGENDYRPFPIDWRFLPEPVLLVKDALRHLCVETSMAMAKFPVTRSIWAQIARDRVLAPALAAHRLFIHIPKTGGTSICSLLYQRNVPHLTANTIFRLYGQDLGDVPSFSVVRHPVERLLSAFRFLKHGGTTLMATSRFEMARVGSLTHFEDFVARLTEKPSRMSCSALLTPQHAFVCNPQGTVMVDELFSLSSERSLQDLCRWLNTGPLPHLNASFREPVSVDSVTIRHIEQLYARDFELFEQVMARTRGG